MALRTLRGLEGMSERELARKPGPVGRLWSIAERFHGGGGQEEDARGTRSFVQRAVMMQEVLAELQSRGVLPGPGNAHSQPPPRALPAPELKEAAHSARVKK